MDVDGDVEACVEAGAGSEAGFCRQETDAARTIIRPGSAREAGNLIQRAIGHPSLPRAARTRTPANSCKDAVSLARPACGSLRPGRPAPAPARRGGPPSGWLRGRA